MRHILPAFMWIAVLALATSAQDSCPILTIDGPPGIVDVGDIATYRASLDLRGSKVTPTFRWTVSVGEIVSGQGTNTIEVRQPNACINATVEVEGFPDSCPLTSSETSCGDPAPDAVKIGEMLNTAPADLDLIRRFRDELNKNPNNQGYIYIAYPPILPKEQVSARERAVMDAMAGERFGHDSRITLVQITSSRDVTEFWRVPPGASNPTFESCEPVRRGCSSIGIERRDGIVKAGDKIVFSVKDRADVEGLSFHWIVMNGTIEGGQGTSSIRVLPTTYITRPVKATLKVRGLPKAARIRLKKAMRCLVTRISQRRSMCRFGASIKPFHGRANASLRASSLAAFVGSRRRSSI